MMFTAAPYRPSTVGRDLNIFAILFVAPHVSKQTWLAILDVGGPHLLLGFLDFAVRIGDISFAIEL